MRPGWIMHADALASGLIIRRPIHVLLTKECEFETLSILLEEIEYCFSSQIRKQRLKSHFVARSSTSFC